MILSSPTLLTAQHQLDNFVCGVDSLDDWLKKRAYANQINGASRTYVVTDEQKVMGYYCLASGALEYACFHSTQYARPCSCRYFGTFGD